MLSPSKTGLLLQPSGSFKVLHASSYQLLGSENCLFLSSDFMLSGGRAGKYSNYQVIKEKKLAFFFFFLLSMKQYSLLLVEVSVWFENRYRFSVFTYSLLIPPPKKQSNCFLASDSSPNAFVKMAVSEALIAEYNTKQQNCSKDIMIFHTLHWVLECITS